MVGRGMSNIQAAKALGLRPSSVGQALRRIYEALRIDNGRALSAWCADQRRSQRSLTKRQEELVGQVCLGKRNKEIAADLGMTEPSVKQALRRIYAHVGVRNARGLVCWALERKI